MHEFAELYWLSFENNPELSRLLAILHTVLETNICYSPALNFKRMLLENIVEIGGFIEDCLPFLGPNQGPKVILHIHALLIGLQHMAEPTPIMKQVIEKEDMSIFNINFKEYFISTLEDMLYDMEYRTKTKKKNIQKNTLIVE